MDVKIADQSLDGFFKLTTEDKETELREALIEAHVTARKQKSVAYVARQVRHLLSMAYCNMQIGLHGVMQIIKAEKSRNPHIATKIKKETGSIYVASEAVKHRLDYFLQVWNQRIEIWLRNFGDRKEANKVAHILTAHGEKESRKMARMIFKEFQNLADVVKAVSIEMAKLLPIKKRIPGVARCGTGTRC